jgi:hypothetical protein
MRQGKVVKVTVALIRARGLDDLLREQLRRTGTIEFVDIPTSSVMAVRLVGEAFEIQPLSEEEQPVGQTEATFEVRGREGRRSPPSSTCVYRLSMQGRDDVRRSVPSLERTVQVRVAPVYATRSFFREHWAWVVGDRDRDRCDGVRVAAWEKLVH